MLNAISTLHLYRPVWSLRKDIKTGYWPSISCALHTGTQYHRLASHSSELTFVIQFLFCAHDIITTQVKLLKSGHVKRRIQTRRIFLKQTFRKTFSNLLWTILKYWLKACVSKWAVKTQWHFTKFVDKRELKIRLAGERILKFTCIFFIIRTSTNLLKVFCVHGLRMLFIELIF